LNTEDVFWVMMLLHLEISYRHFGGACCLHLHSSTLYSLWTTWKMKAVCCFYISVT